MNHLPFAPLRYSFIFLLLANLCVSLPLSAQPHTQELFSGPSVDFTHGPLQISQDGRHFVYADGTPFFWLGDTAWELFHRLSLEEADRYLEDRRSKGFTVIQAVVLADLKGLSDPNPEGHTPLLHNDPAQPDEAYFKDVDHVVNQAEKLGLYIGMLPTWGDKFNKKWGFGPEIFTPENAKAFGEFLGRRYRNKPIVWILGGDRIPETENHYAIIRAMADGLREGDGGTHLITFHPWGETSSSSFFHQDAWLDFNMFQSGHIASDMPNYRYTQADYKKNPPKPVVDGEPRYEDHPVKWDPKNGWFNNFDVRQAAYWSVLSGAAGHTYGNNNLWQMWQPGREPLAHARTPWYEALQQAGAWQMGYMRLLFTSRPFLQLQPAQDLLPDPQEEGAGYQCAALAKDGSYLIAYTPLGKPLTIQLSQLQGTTLQAYWFDPRSGKARAIDTFPKTASRTFEPPGSPGRGNDWVLVVDSTDEQFPTAPGVVPKHG